MSVRRSPLADAFESLRARRILLFGGKGGVGKTTVSIAAALHFSRERKTILFTSDPASNVEDVFTANGERRTANLQIESLHAEQLYDAFLKENLANFLELGDRGTYLDKDELRRFFELSLPGVDELMAWMRIGELAESHSDALIVVDTAPTGHTLRMLGAAEHFRQFAAALDSMQEKRRGMMRQFMRQQVRDALDDFIDAFEERARRRREMLADRGSSAFVPVMLSEPWVVEQTKRLIDEVREDGLDVPMTILNRAAADCDCQRCRDQAVRDREAHDSLAPMPVFDARRSCIPLDSPERIAKWSG